MTWNNEIFAARTPDELRRHFNDRRTLTYDDLPTACDGNGRQARSWADIK